jgi:hypothetical protein
MLFNKLIEHTKAINLLAIDALSFVSKEERDKAYNPNFICEKAEFKELEKPSYSDLIFPYLNEFDKESLTKIYKNIRCIILKKIDNDTNITYHALNNADNKIIKEIQKLNKKLKEDFDILSNQILSKSK